MKKMHKFTILFVTLAAIFPVQAFAKEFVLQYQKANRWVATEDATSLRNMLKLARNNDVKTAKVILPVSKRDISLERLVVLRDILEQQLKHGVVLEETIGKTDRNTITIILP